MDRGITPARRNFLPLVTLGFSVWATFVLTAISINAHAELLEEDDPVFGPDSLTFDTETGLNWLDLTISANRSFADVSSQFGPGGDFEGFRYATIAEIQTLWANAGVSDLEMSTAANLAPVAVLMSLIGCTASCGSSVVVSSIGLSGSFASTTDVFSPAVNQLLNKSPPQGGAFLTSNLATTTFQSVSRGSWLVRPASTSESPVAIPVWLLYLVQKRSEEN